MEQMSHWTHYDLVILALPSTDRFPYCDMSPRYYRFLTTKAGRMHTELVPHMTHLSVRLRKPTQTCYIGTLSGAHSGVST
jgi:hypothetical protein